MFENNPSATDRTADDIVENVKELCRLDPSYASSAVLLSIMTLSWIKNDFGAKSSITAVSMTHAVLNDDSSVSFLFAILEETSFQCSAFADSETLSP
jgi:hypothetical protein